MCIRDSVCAEKDAVEIHIGDLGIGDGPVHRAQVGQILPAQQDDGDGAVLRHGLQHRQAAHHQSHVLSGDELGNPAQRAAGIHKNDLVVPHQPRRFLGDPGLGVGVAVVRLRRCGLHFRRDDRRGAADAERPPAQSLDRALHQHQVDIPARGGEGDIQRFGEIGHRHHFIFLQQREDVFASEIRSQHIIPHF